MSNAERARTWSIGLEKLVSKAVPAEFKRFRDALALDGVANLINMTNVDTGRARGNWQTTVGEPAEGYLDITFPGASKDERGAAAARFANDRARAVLKNAPPFADIWIHNGVPYVAFLNDGTPRFKGNNMMQITVERLRGQVAKKLSAFGEP